jgi:DNA polymerase I-like protein with 3'-5' exonuclease and polymerase domains
MCRQVAALMAKMERAGVACMPAVLSDHRATLAARLAAIKARAAQLVGYEFNLSSSSQLAKVLYEDLRLTPPAGGASATRAGDCDGRSVLTKLVTTRCPAR